MPDPAKFEKLRKIGYAIPIACGLCKHSRWSLSSGSGFGWGTCSLHQYKHGKHTGSPREVSIVTTGTCPSAELDDMMKDLLGPHAEFLPEGAENHG